MAGTHPGAGQPCPHCGEPHGHGGPVEPYGFTFSLIEVAEAMVRVGRGDTYADIAAETRRSAQRPRQAPRPLNRRRDPSGRPLAANVVRPARTYDYTTAKPPMLESVMPSRTANLVTSWIDAFAPSVVDAYAYKAWPSVLAVDSLPIKRRRLAEVRDPKTNERTGVVRRVAAGERNGEILAATDHSTSQATPCLIALEGGKDERSWLRFLNRLPTATPPTWVVMDIDDAAANAVKNLWPDAIIYRCEEHLKRRIRKALTEDGIPQWTLAQPARGEIPPESPSSDSDTVPDLDLSETSTGRRNRLDLAEDPLFRLVESCQWSPSRWRAFATAVRKRIPKKSAATRKWIRANTWLVLDQWALRRAHRGMPRSTGAVEANLARVRSAIDTRSGFFKNARRLDKMLGLVRLNIAGVANETMYADLIGRGLASRPTKPQRKTGRLHPVGIDWVSPRDKAGACSIDEMIDETMSASALAFVDADADRSTRTMAAKTARVDAELAAKGLPPSRSHRPVRGPRSYRRVGGMTIADFPDLNAEYDPARNKGVIASAVAATTIHPVVWSCHAHEAEGHLHIWETPAVRRTGSMTGCPKCTGRQVCPSTMLRATRPDLVAEWVSADKADVTPETESAGSNEVVTWKCVVAEHPTFRQRICVRAKQHTQCPSCGVENRRRKAKLVVAERGRGQRVRAKAARERARPVDPRVALISVGDLYSVVQAADLLHKSGQTVRNWISTGRLIPVDPDPGEKGFLIAGSEIARILGPVPPEDSGGDKAA